LTTAGKNISTYFGIILFGLLLVAHLPFLDADPDINISYSRGPFTDEGLNTIQIRNLVNHGELNIEECDNLLKTPLFNFSLLIPFTIFGTSLVAGRLFILLFLIVILGLTSKQKYFRGIVMVFGLITLLEYHVFQFSHFVLAEMMAVTLTILSIYYLSLYADRKGKNQIKYLALSSVFLSLTYYAKIQFIYFVPLIPAVLLLMKMNRINSIKTYHIILVSALTLLFLLLYFFGWYMPNRSIYDHMMIYQSGFFDINEKTLSQINFNLQYYFLEGKNMIVSILFAITVLLGIYLFRNSNNMQFRFVFIAAILWFLLETHKLTMEYLPSRYLISMICAAGFLIASVLNEAFMYFIRSKKPKIFNWLIGGIVALLFMFNLTDYKSMLNDRSFAIRDINTYVSENYEGDRPVIGAWAPSLCWKSNAYSFPVWDKFLNFRDPVNTYNPKIIFSEYDEEDSNQAYLNQNIILQNEADSSRRFIVGHWKVVAWWMP